MTVLRMNCNLIYELLMESWNLYKESEKLSEINHVFIAIFYEKAYNVTILSK